MRLLLIRHAQSVGNATDLKHYKGANMTERQQHVWRENMREAELSSAHGTNDFPLTDLGLQQAQLLKDFWLPRLVGCDKGRLRLFVSPFRRTLQTAQPLYAALHASLGVRALVMPDLCERYQLRAQQDWDQEGNFHGSTRTPSGMTGHSIQMEHVWADLEDGFGDGDPTKPWCIPASSATPFKSRLKRGYWESDTQAIERVRRVALWLRRMQQEQPAEAVVALVVHGDFISMLLSCLLRMPYATDLTMHVRNELNTHFTQFNTAVSCIHMPPTAQPLVVEWLARTDHLGVGSGPLNAKL